jgi:hypothetical protein
MCLGFGCWFCEDDRLRDKQRLEDEIDRLSGLPPNPGRMTAIKLLQKKLKVLLNDLQAE